MNENYFKELNGICETLSVTINTKNPISKLNCLGKLAFTVLAKTDAEHPLSEEYIDLLGIIRSNVCNCFCKNKAEFDIVSIKTIDEVVHLEIGRKIDESTIFTYYNYRYYSLRFPTAVIDLNLIS